MSSTTHYYGLDGDKIGALVELYIIQGDIETLARFSTSVSAALEMIRSDILAMGGSVFLCAGDSIFFRGNSVLFDDAWCGRILEQFATATGRTASLGIGESGMAAYVALKLAKAMGGGRMVTFPLENGLMR